MKTFKQFITEAYFDPNVQGRSQVQRVGSDGSKIGAWPIPPQMCIGGCEWFNVEEIEWTP